MYFFASILGSVYQMKEAIAVVQVPSLMVRKCIKLHLRVFGIIHLGDDVIPKGRDYNVGILPHPKNSRTIKEFGG